MSLFERYGLIGIMLVGVFFYGLEQKLQAWWTHGHSLSVGKHPFGTSVWGIRAEAAFSGSGAYFLWGIGGIVFLLLLFLQLPEWSANSSAPRVNFGAEAEEAQVVKFEMEDFRGKRYCQQATAYRGHHYMHCTVKYQGRTVSKRTFPIFVSCETLEGHNHG